MTDKPDTVPEIDYEQRAYKAREDQQRRWAHEFTRPPDPDGEVLRETARALERWARESEDPQGWSTHGITMRLWAERIWVHLGRTRR